MGGDEPAPGRIRIEVAYALPQQQLILALEVEQGTTLREAVQRSGILERFPQIDLERDRLGIFSRPAAPDAVLREGDRVEIYRPLIIDPKEARRRRARPTRR
ncbi:MAG TPA: RnfH family protein [Solimonas sp.]|nr:RnfH family protein [Solimonas sp.]